MKIKVSVTDLVAAIALVGKAVGSRSSHPVLGGFLLEAKGEALKISGYDLTLGISTALPCVVEKEGVAVVPAGLLTGITSKLNRLDVLTVEVKELQAKLSTPGGKYSISCFEPSEYPAIPEARGSSIRLPLEALKRGTGAVGFACSRDDTKQVLTGIHLTAGDDSLEFAATDGHRLATYCAPTETLNYDAFKQWLLDLTIPPVALRTLAGVQAEEDALLYLDDGWLIVQAGATTISSRILDGQYPQYKSLIPGSFATEVAVDRRALLAAVARVDAVGRAKSVIVLEWKRAPVGSLTLSAEVQDVGSAQEQLAAQVTGEDGKLCLNSSYLTEGLSSIAESEVVLKINTPTSPILVVPLGASPQVYLLMPVQIRG